MSLFKAWSENKLNKKFVVPENFAELVSKVKRFCFHCRVGDLTLFEALTGEAFDLLNWQHSGEFAWGLPGTLLTLSDCAYVIFLIFTRTFSS